MDLWLFPKNYNPNKLMCQIPWSNRNAIIALLDLTISTNNLGNTVALIVCHML